MRTPAERVRKYVRAAREARKWSQYDLAREAGGISRTTVKALEDGAVLREGKESAIEDALGWRIGSLDQIREGGEPTVKDTDPPRDLASLTRQEAWERAEHEVSRTHSEEAGERFMLQWAAAVSAKRAKTANHDRYDVK